MHDRPGGYPDRSMVTAVGMVNIRPERTPQAMTTTGKRYLKRKHEREAGRIIDERARMVLRTVLAEERGKALSAYLRVFAKEG